MKGPLGNIMKQAQEMQEKLKTAQESLASIEVTGDPGKDGLTGCGDQYSRIDYPGNEWLTGKQLSA